ncbi:DHA2 family efflux MFS transporter permease subunit [Streptomyces longwoodensis]|uniref:DHA2 family efflux MFS transporter permease subunit n=1 Tax=Streptomyces longwoodensis TaxID=68231 RepID=UPI0033CB2214
MSCTIPPIPAVEVPEPVPGRHARPWRTLAALALGVSMIGLDSSVVSLANPAIGRDLHASAAGLQWVTNAYLLALAATLILGGKLGDRFGRRTIYLTGVAGFTLASVAIGLSGSIEDVVAFRAAQGVFGALLLPNTLGILRAAFAPGEFTLAVGIWAMISSASTALGPIVGGFLVEHVSWESIFYLNAPLGVITLLVGALFLSQSRSTGQRQRFDIPGVLLLALGQNSVIFGIIKGESWGWSSGTILTTLGTGIAALVLFGWHETRTPNPLLPMRLFRNRTLTIGACITALTFFVLLGSMFFVMLYLQNVQAMSPIESGVRTLPLSLGSLAAAPAGAVLTERLGARLTMPVGMLLLASAAFWMLTWSAGSSYGLLLPSLFALGVGSGMVMAATSEAVLTGAPMEDAGVAGGIQSTSIQIGGAFGTSVLVSLLGSRAAATLTGELTQAGVPATLAAALSTDKGAVAMGGTPRTGDMPARLAAAVTDGSTQAFMNGLHRAAFTAGLLCIAGAVLAAVGVRPNPR